MKLQVNSPDFKLTPALKQRLKRRITFALNRFSDRIRLVKVWLRDINGPKGGIDKVCRILVEGSAGWVVPVEVTRQDAYEAIDFAGERVNRAVTRRVSKHKNRIRRRPVLDY